MDFIMMESTNANPLNSDTMTSSVRSESHQCLTHLQILKWMCFHQDDYEGDPPDDLWNEIF
jgi:hypothetical protein